MQSEQITCSSEDELACIPVVRKSGCAFATEVNWYAENGDAIYQEHYNLNKGLSLVRLSEVNFH